MTDLRTRATQTAAEVADRLAAPDRLPEVTTASARAAGQPDPWQPVSLTTGHPGVAVLHAVLGRPDRAHAHLAAALAALPATSTASVFHGYGALVAATAVVATHAGGYTAFLDRGHRWLATHALAAVREQRARWATGQIWADDRYWDAICGVTGPGRILLAAVAAGHDEQRPAVEEILAFLVDLAQPDRRGRGAGDHGPGECHRNAHRGAAATRPGWWIPLDDQGRHPPGGADAGLAHGISGPLALLALARSAGVTVAGQDDAIRLISTWLLSWRTADHRWPGIIGPDEAPGPGAAPTRSAWCYGAAGIAHTLLLAGDALGDDGLRSAATTAVVAMSRQDTDSWQLWGPTICHGHAGLLAIAHRVHASTGEPAAARVAATAAELTLTGWDDRAPWGFGHTHLWSPSGPVVSDVAGLLVGAGGVALALAEWGAAPLTHPASPGTDATTWGWPLLID